MLYINIRDDGEDSISDVKGIKALDVLEFADLEDAYWWLKENPKAFKSVVLDTVSQLQTIVVKETAARKKKGNVSRAGDWGTMSKRDWGDVAALLKEWLSNFRDLTGDGMEVVFIAQDRAFNVDDEGEDEEALAPEIGPALSPSVAKHLNAAVTVIGNTFIRERAVKSKDPDRKKETLVKEYCLRVGPSSLYVTKVRKPKSSKVPEVIVDPEYSDIVDIIEGEA